MWLFCPKIKSNLHEIKSLTLQRILWEENPEEGKIELITANIKVEFFPDGFIREILVFYCPVFSVVTSVLLVIMMGRARFVFHSESVSPSQHWQWLVLGEGDLSHDEAPAKLSTGTGDSTTSAGAFRSQLRPGRRSNILHPPPPSTHHHPDTNNQPNIHYSTQDLHPAHCLYWLSAGWRSSGS